MTASTVGDIEAPEAAGKPEDSLVAYSVNDTKEEKQLAAVRDVFSFGSGPKKNVCLVLGFGCAIVSGCVFPAMAFFFAQSFQSLGTSVTSEDFASQIRELAFTFMALGYVASLLFMNIPRISKASNTMIRQQRICLRIHVGAGHVSRRISWRNDT